MQTVGLTFGSGFYDKIMNQKLIMLYRFVCNLRICKYRCENTITLISNSKSTNCRYLFSYGRV